MKDFTLSGRGYYWAYTVYEGKLVIDGYYRTEAEAHQFAAQKIPVSFEVVCLNTIDRTKARDHIKHEYLAGGGDFGTVLKRVRYK